MAIVKCFFVEALGRQRRAVIISDKRENFSHASRVIKNSIHDLSISNVDRFVFAYIPTQHRCQIHRKNLKKKKLVDLLTSQEH